MADLDHVHKIILDAIEKLPMERRLFPDLYVDDIVKALYDEGVFDG